MFNKRNQGFTLVEILLAYAFWSLVFPTLYTLWIGYTYSKESITQYLYSSFQVTASSSETYKNTSTYIDRDEQLFSYEHFSNPKFNFEEIHTDWQQAFGKASCSEVDGASVTEESVTWPAFSYGNLIEDIAIRGSRLYVSMNSATSSDTDFYVLDIQNLHVPSIIGELNSGPGFGTFKIAGRVAYVADTSSVNQLQAIDISNPIPKVVWKLAVPGANSSTSPITKSLFYSNGVVYLGAEKTVLPELYTISVTSTSPRILSQKEIGAGVNALFEKNDRLFVLTPLDPEIQVLDTTLHDISTYDSAGHVGNGKRIDIFNDDIYFGRTIGGDEIEMLSINDSGEIFKFFSYKPAASIDALISSKNYVYVLTNDDRKEFQIFKKSSNELQFVRGIDLPQRAVTMACFSGHIAVALPQEIKIFKVE